MKEEDSSCFCCGNCGKTGSGVLVIAGVVVTAIKLEGVRGRAQRLPRNAN